METDDGARAELARLGAALRESLGDELRAEAEEAERAAAIAALRARTLLDVAAELRSRGDTVAVTAGGRTFVGVVAHVSSDHVVVALPAGDVVDVSASVPVTIRVVERRAEGGRAAGPGPASLRARLLELEMDAATVEVRTTDATEVRGRLVAIGRDHVAVDTAEGEAFVTLSAVVSVRRV